MTVYAILSSRPNTELMQAVQSLFGDSCLMFGPSVAYVVSADLPAALADRIGVVRRDAAGNTTGKFEDVVVQQVSPSYFGYAQTNVWDWLLRSFENRP